MVFAACGIWIMPNQTPQVIGRGGRLVQPHTDPPPPNAKERNTIVVRGAVNILVVYIVLSDLNLRSKQRSSKRKNNNVSPIMSSSQEGGSSAKQHKKSSTKNHVKRKKERGAVFRFCGMSKKTSSHVGFLIKHLYVFISPYLLY